MTPHEPNTCRSCGAAILWAEHESSGRMAPIDATANPAGNAILLPEGRYRILSKAELERAEPRTLRYMPHFASCPTAGRHRGGGS